MRGTAIGVTLAVGAGVSDRRSARSCHERLRLVFVARSEFSDAPWLGNADRDRRDSELDIEGSVREEHDDGSHMQRRRGARRPRAIAATWHSDSVPPRPSRPHPPSPLTATMGDSATLTSVLESQTTLLQEAALALPHSFSQCTYSLGHIRQAVYLCLTCARTSPSSTPPGICSACSIACHTDHEQLELFPKRAFRCDCPTRALTHACTLHTALEEPNETNEYGRNFQGVFCRCGRPYDAEKERETMIQCLACEVRLCVRCDIRAHPCLTRVIGLVP